MKKDRLEMLETMIAKGSEDPFVWYARAMELRSRERLDDVRAAGSVFVGSWTPESVGDYCSGTNHVLPTYGFARSYSSLGVTDFLRSMTVQELSQVGLETIGPVAATLADLEGLDAHSAAVTRRLATIRRESETPS